MRKRYLIMMYQGPIDGWRTVTYSDVASATVYDSDEGTYSREEAEKLWELVADGDSGDVPVIMVQILRDNKIETEYK